jgi:glycosyltransferase involved in cell wall biosynthesis
MDQEQPEKISSISAGTIEEKLLEPESSVELPPIQSEPISALLPTYNDRAGLQSTLETWISVLNELNREYEILLIDDSSSDGSFELSQSLGEKNPQVHILHHVSHGGFGACLRTGLAAARFPLLLICTCDGRYEPADLTRFFKWIDKVHLVAAYRMVASKRYKRNWPESFFSWIIRIIFALRLKDPECWFLLARRSIFDRIPIQSTGPFGFTELLSKANFLGCLMSELSVAYHPMPELDAKWSNSKLREKLAGFRQVFSHPDFGPAKLLEK